MQKVAILIIIFCLFICSFHFGTVFAQSVSDTANNTTDTSFGTNQTHFIEVAHIIGVKNEDIKDGAIISITTEGYVLSKLAYDPQVLGVVSRNVAITLYDNTNRQGVPIIVKGSVEVLVTAKNGSIKKGDELTTSSTPGVGAKAIESGNVLGTALEDYQNADTAHIGIVAINLNPHYSPINVTTINSNSLSDMIRLVIFPTKQAHAPTFVYVTGGIVLATILLIFLSFGRTAIKSLNKNPNASRKIHLIISFTIGMIFLIVLSSLTLVFLLLRL